MNIAQIRICGRYRLIERINTPNPEKAYLAVNIQKDELVLVRFEDSKAYEKRILHEGKMLQDLQGGIGIPSMIWCGHDEGSVILVTQHFGKCLRDQLAVCGGKFTLKTVLMLADRMLDLYHYLHFKLYLVKSMGPELLSFGSGEYCTILYLNNLSRIGKVIQQEESFLSRLSVFTAADVVKGEKHSFRSDLVGLGYLLVYLRLGQLPWYKQGDQVYKPTETLKKSLPKYELTNLLSTLPIQFKKYFKYLEKLMPRAKPDYGYLKFLFKQCMIRQGHDYDDVYDWLLVDDPADEPLLYAPITLDLFEKEDEFVRNQIEQFMAVEDGKADSKAVRYNTQLPPSDPVRVVVGGKDKKNICMIF